MEMNEKCIFPDPSKHPDWITPHTPEWYSQLNSSVGEYRYPWNSTFEMPTAEMMFAEHLSSFITPNSRMLDVGCGHGNFTGIWGDKVKEVIGIDNRENFIKKADKNNNHESTKYLVVNADDSRSLFRYCLHQEGTMVIQRGISYLKAKRNYFGIIPWRNG